MVSWPVRRHAGTAIAPATGGKGKRKRWVGPSTWSTDRNDLLVATFVAHNPERTHRRGSRRAEPVRQRYTLGTVGPGGAPLWRYVGRTSQGDGSEVLIASPLGRERLGCGHGLTELVAADGFDAVSRRPSESLAGFVGIFGSAYPEASSRPTSLDSTGRGSGIAFDQEGTSAAWRGR
jgi:hypothetical protein